MRAKSSNAPSILSRDLVITGEISTDGDVQVEGRVEGNIKASNLTIGEQGSVNGKVTAGKVLIRGKVTGKIDASTIEMAETANVLADLVQDHLTIANGAFFDGKCTRKSKPAGAVSKPKA
ncbi:MAG: polymer-forming cytoskeletal protein [Robiginitomaculum sp.]|nr:polymer-forming cytoskeletal protein [Robiginitomaculum sp.]